VNLYEEHKEHSEREAYYDSRQPEKLEDAIEESMEGCGPGRTIGNLDTGR